MYQRAMAKELISSSKQYPVVTITGPRQSGKTTLVRTIFPNMPYVNLESPQIFELASSDPIGFLNNYPDGAVLDEIQKCPKLLSEIQVRVDEHKKNGMFILTGSHQIGLRGAIAQSLAGRTAILHLLPMSLEELKDEQISCSINEILCKGFYPRIYEQNLEANKAYNNYVQTYLERDLRQMIEVKNLQLFQRFLKLCAGRIGQLFNKESIANEVGVSSKTISHWLSILEASYLIFLLPPYFENFGKRIVKTPKIYFCDVGLAAYLLDIETSSQMDRDPLRGQLFENLVILELIKSRWNQGLEHRLYFYRDSQQNEVDIIFRRANDLIPIEVKSAQTFSSSFLKGINKFKKIVETRCQNPSVIYGGDQEQSIHDVKLYHYSNAAKAIQ
ncbi:MAG: DUF4143 domain-containing protein [Chlamydiales bacterium]|nr:ATP-binding protein [Chlamydiales bacterium]NCF70964.1 DUF4143 domain-containing protein [Chlamydiales bacterium]